nr:potassium channel family protein [uncultured Jannaschia sp.]
MAGWALVFQGAGDWILVSKTNAPASPWQRLYLAAYSVATLGFGAYEPDSPAGRLLTASSAMTGFIVLTFSVGAVSTISQVLAARDAVIAAMHAHAEALEAGADPAEALDRTLDLVAVPLSSVASAIQTLPVQHRLHGETEARAFSRALDQLDRALPDASTDPRSRLAARSMDQILEVLARDWLRPWLAGDGRRVGIEAFLRADRLEGTAER